MNIQAIIFDCFGVLYVDATEAYGARYPHLKNELKNLDSACNHGFISRQEYLENISKLTGDSPEVIDAAFLAEHTANTPLIEYIKNELKPHYKIALLSNIGPDFMQHFFDEHQLHDLFDTAVLSNIEGVTKPDPEIYKRTAQRLQLAPEACIMIDDREENCHGAEAAGMQSILFQSFAQMQKELEVKIK